MLGAPWFLLLLLAVPLLLWRRSGEAPAARLAFPAAALAAAVRPSLRRRLAPLSTVLRVLTFVVVVVCLARPQSGESRDLVATRGIDIQLVLDVSSSMTRVDLAADRSRLRVATDVIDGFIARRPEDRIGLVTFARFPRPVCPLTLDHAALREFLGEVSPVGRDSEETTTAIGVALAAAVLRLKDRSERTRVVVLLTDGEEMEHDVEPLQAAELARAYGIRVYAVAVATRSGPWASQLRALAELTGGQGFIATDERSLRAIYQRIDVLEKQRIEETRFTTWSDLYPVVLWVAVLLLFAELPFDLLFLRRSP